MILFFALRKSPSRAEVHLNRGHHSDDIDSLGTNDGVVPVHEGDLEILYQDCRPSVCTVSLIHLLLTLERRSVLLLEEDRGRLCCLPFSSLGVPLVFRQRLDLRSGWPTLDRNRYAGGERW